MKKVLLFVLLVFIISCKKDRDVDFDEILINKIASEDFTLPSQYNMFHLYAKCENEQLLEINVQQLRMLYNKSNKIITFEKYLKLVLDQEQNINRSIDIECFSINVEIKKEYQKIGVQNLITKFFEKKNNLYRLKEEISDEKRKTLFYYCFLNNYVGAFDDYMGYYYLTKTTELY